MFITCSAITGIVVARVRLNQLNAEAYVHAVFSAIFTTTSTRHPEFSVEGTLAGIILDRSNTQVQGLEKAVGKDVADKVVKGCQVI